jgi:hypothetical protein
MSFPSSALGGRVARSGRRVRLVAMTIHKLEKVARQGAKSAAPSTLSPCEGEFLEAVWREWSLLLSQTSSSPLEWLSGR